MTIEYWVVKVLMHRGTAVPRPMRLGDNTSDVPQGVMARVVDGELACIPPDMCIAEPLQWFASDGEAQDHCAKLKRDNPGEDYRVILNADGV